MIRWSFLVVSVAACVGAALAASCAAELVPHALTVEPSAPLQMDVGPCTLDVECDTESVRDCVGDGATIACRNGRCVAYGEVELTCIDPSRRVPPFEPIDAGTPHGAPADTGAKDGIDGDAPRRDIDGGPVDTDSATSDQDAEERSVQCRDHAGPAEQPGSLGICQQREPRPVGWTGVNGWFQAVQIGPATSRVEVREFTVWASRGGEVEALTSTTGHGVDGMGLYDRDPWFGTDEHGAAATSVEDGAFVFTPSDAPNRVWHGWTARAALDAEVDAVWVTAEIRVEGDAIVQLGSDWWQTRDAPPADYGVNNLEAGMSDWVSSDCDEWVLVRTPATDGSVRSCGEDDDSTGAQSDADAGAVDASGGTDVGPTFDTAGPDGDGDGYLRAVDCDDTNDRVHPGAPELCNRRDDNCDGVLDDACTEDLGLGGPERPSEPISISRDGAHLLVDASTFSIGSWSRLDDVPEATLQIAWWGGPEWSHEASVERTTIGGASYVVAELPEMPTGWRPFSAAYTRCGPAYALPARFNLVAAGQYMRIDPSDVGAWWWEGIDDLDELTSGLAIAYVGGAYAAAGASTSMPDHAYCP